MELPKLYKYRYFNENTVTRLPDGEEIPQWQQVLYDGLIFPACPETFNDPYDCDFLINQEFLQSRFIREFLVQRLSSRCSLSQQEKSSIMTEKDFDKIIARVLSDHFKITSKDVVLTLKEEIKDAIKSTKSVLKVACFSEVNNSILMWSHYSQNHSGFCIEYDFTSWKGNAQLKPVQYIRKRQPIQGNDIDGKTRNIGLVLINEALNKADVWSYEREWRIIFTKPSLFHPEFNGKTLVYYLKDFITGVYLGAQAKDNYIQKICEHYSKTDVHVYQMQMNPEKYELEAKLIQ